MITNSDLNDEFESCTNTIFFFKRESEKNEYVVESVTTYVSD